MQYVNLNISVSLSSCSQNPGIHCLPSNTPDPEKIQAQQHRQAKAISGSNFKNTLPTSRGNLLQMTKFTASGF